MSEHGFERIVEDLYAGTLDDAAWKRAIVGVADFFRASDAVVFAFNPSTGAVLRDEQHRLDPDEFDKYRQYWALKDPRSTAMLPVGQPATELTLAIPQWHRQPILNEFLLPADVPHIMAVWLRKSRCKNVAMSVQGTRKRGPFEDRDLEIFRRLLPHVGRALEIRDQLERARMKGAILDAKFDHIKVGVLLIDRSGRILESNVEARLLLNGENGIHRSRDGTLWLREPAGGELARWIRTGAPAPNSAVDGLLRVPRDRRLPLSVLVTTLNRQSLSWLAGDPHWLVLIIDPERRMEISIELIERDLGITARESEIATLLFAGSGVQEIAIRLSVSVHTVRTQLKSIFTKTGTHSQSELVRRIAFGPAMFAAARDGSTAAEP